MVDDYMTKLNVKTFITILLFAIAIAVLYLYFGESLSKRLNIQNAQKYPLAGFDILSEVKQEPALSLISGQLQIISQNLNYSVINSLPKEAKIYEYESSNIIKPQNQKALIESFGLKANTQQIYSDQILGKYISVATNSSSLRIYEDLGILSYSKDDPTLSNKFPNIFDKEVYKVAGENFLASKGIDISNLTYDRTKYYSADSYDANEVSSPTKAHIIEFSYRAKVSGFPIIDNKTDIKGNLLRVWLDVDKNVIRMDYEEIGKIKDSKGTFKLKTQDQISKEIQSGKIKLITSETPIGENITSTSLVGISLGYYAINGFLVPVYIFQSQSQTESGQKGPSYFIMEAVAK